MSEDEAQEVNDSHEFDEDSDVEPSDEDIEDDSEQEEEVAAVAYDITSYGWDADVDGLVRRLQEEKILIPKFQRSFVWSIRQASRFVESLLLGLPVPGIFLAVEPEAGTRVVIDGQQRLKTLQFFRQGVFDPKPDRKTQRVFRLFKVQEPFDGLTYDALDDRDRQRLDDSIIPVTIVQQNSPANDDTSVYHIFERLNSGGQRLTPQEIRSAIYHGTCIDRIRELNQVASWREHFAGINKRLKDQELILRFLALSYTADDYERPMAEFLNKFLKPRRNAGDDFLTEASDRFTRVIDLMTETLGRAAFRPERSLNAAVFDSTMVGLSRRLESGGTPDANALKEAHSELLDDEQFIESTSKATADATAVTLRLRLATEAFAEI